MKVESLKNSFETLKKIPVEKLSQYMTTNISDYLVVSLIELAILDSYNSDSEIRLEALKLLHQIETTPMPPEG